MRTESSAVPTHSEHVSFRCRPGGGSAFARSAVGVAAMQYAGIYHGPEIEKGLEFLKQFQPLRQQSVGHYSYGHYYAVQAMHSAGGEHRKSWWPAIRDELLSKQTKDGYWPGQQRVRHRHGPHHPTGPQPPAPDLPALVAASA